MIIYILMFDDCVERASTDCRKMNELAAALNGDPDITGQYDVIPVDLEDAPNQAMHSDGEGNPVLEGVEYLVNNIDCDTTSLIRRFWGLGLKE